MLGYRIYLGQKAVYFIYDVSKQTWILFRHFSFCFILSLIFIDFRNGPHKKKKSHFLLSAFISMTQQNECFILLIHFQSFFAVCIRLYLWVYSLFTNSNSVIYLTESFPRTFPLFPIRSCIQIGIKWIQNLNKANHWTKCKYYWKSLHSGANNK